jgi:hypothetical protein
LITAVPSVTTTRRRLLAAIAQHKVETAATMNELPAGNPPDMVIGVDFGMTQTGQSYINLDALR